MVEISIIVPIYNAEDYLYQCLNGLTEQLFKDIEIICVNDGSTDRSNEIKERTSAKDQRIRIQIRVQR